MAVASKEKIREIYEVLPKFDCGLCGFGNCGQFARAVTEGRASPFGCRQDSWVGYRISQIIGAGTETLRYHHKPYRQPVLARTADSRSSESLRQEVEGLCRRADDILARIEQARQRQS
jgi:Na+-translocating ferredoxin:NAD+ oxidoreductase RNF subunit RnfB